ncbi:MAG TPA: DUF262 domain-containing protein [Thermoanaerobaculia bacterium]|jgi:hypothetical protein|nr:DUF262 domain-containing protein [Thermoanaerobaculia bacterium]
MARHFVNLDALIPREDFDVEDDAAISYKTGGNLKLSEIESSGLVFQTLRKPDFQRETSNWTPEKIVELVRGFVDGDLIPAIIMWWSPKSSNIFVIDGAHRLSALLAWVHDDYGDRNISTAFFRNSIPPEQERAAQEARTLIKTTIGSYQLLKSAAQNHDFADKTQELRAKNAGLLPIELQWVKGSARKAEASFFTINQSATAIHETELRIIKARRKPNAVAARAIIHAGTGHKYWSEFPLETQREVERLSRDIYGILFDPSLETPIKTLDLPVAGSGYSADSLSLTFDFVNFASNYRPEMWMEPKPNSRRAKNPRPVLPDDVDGSGTIQSLRAVRSIASMISGDAPKSLGLHPVVYFYGATGRYQPAAFLATAALVRELDQSNAFPAFTEARERFEEFILRFGYFKNQIVGSYGSGTRSLDPLLTFFKIALTGIQQGMAESEIIDSLLSEPRLRLQEKNEEDRTSRRNFTSQSKSAAFLRAAIDGAVRCGICRARVHIKAISIDHIIRKQDGGSGDIENAQPTHPYCNTGYKEMLNSRARKVQGLADHAAEL